MHRRDFLSSVTGAGLLLSGCQKTPSSAESTGSSAAPDNAQKADVTLHIGPVLVDIAKDHTISTIGYNGQAPGPLIRLHEGVPVTVDIFNETEAPELVHWHGQIVPTDVDGALEEKSLVAPANGHLRYQLTPQPSGARFVHTHVMPMSDLSRGTYSGQFAFVYVEPRTNPGAYDQEIFLATHEWEPFFTTEEEEEEDEDAGPKPEPKKDEKPNGWEIGYQRFTINGRTLGFGEPIRVKQGQLVFLLFNDTTTTENIQ